jgi:hypothetical protein
MLFYLQKLDVLACRAGKTLNFVELLGYAIQSEHMDLCQWMLHTMSQRNIIFDACDIIACYYNRLNNITPVNLTWFFECVGPFQHIMTFQNIVGLFHKIFIAGDIYVFRIKQLTSDILIESLTWLENRMGKMNYVKLFKSLENAKQRTHRSKRNLEVLKWLEQRILDNWQTPPYSVLVENEFFKNSPIAEWAQQKLTL